MSDHDRDHDRGGVAADSSHDRGGTGPDSSRDSGRGRLRPGDRVRMTAERLAELDILGPVYGVVTCEEYCGTVVVDTKTYGVCGPAKYWELEPSPHSPAWCEAAARFLAARLEDDPADGGE